MSLSLNIYFIPIESHNVSKSEVVHIDPLLDDTYSFPTNIGTLVIDCDVPSSPPMTTPSSSKTVNPSPTHSS